MGDTLDPQGEQLNEDDFDELQNPMFGDRHPGVLFEEKTVSRNVLPTIKLMQPAEVRESIRLLHREQRQVFDLIVGFSHQYLRGANPEAPLLIVQGKVVPEKRN